MRMPDAALTAAHGHRAADKEELLAGPEMLNTADLADLLDMSEEDVQLKQKRQENSQPRIRQTRIWYPAGQVQGNRRLLAALPRLFAMLGNDPWRLFRFLQQRYGELGGDHTLDALRHDEVRHRRLFLIGGPRPTSPGVRNANAGARARRQRLAPDLPRPLSGSAGLRLRIELIL
jgi:hypothetical protein